ncbi:hypothetical protein [Gaiella sp.]|uniref:hypothetical protein n=1 Tax=Gaiella sp. TaxID=2663207 RepID=UPI003262FDD4
MGLLDRIRSGTNVPDDGPALATPGRRLTLREAGTRVNGGEELLPAAREFLDQAGRASAHELAAMIAERPDPTGNARADALLAGVAEYTAGLQQIACPRWTSEPERLLDRFWFVSTEPGFRAIALAQTPVALKRRGILWSARSMRRV